MGQSIYVTLEDSGILQILCGGITSDLEQPELTIIFDGRYHPPSPSSFELVATLRALDFTTFVPFCVVQHMSLPRLEVLSVRFEYQEMRSATEQGQQQPHRLQRFSVFSDHITVECAQLRSMYPCLTEVHMEGTGIKPEDQVSAREMLEERVVGAWRSKSGHGDVVVYRKLKVMIV